MLQLLRKSEQLRLFLGLSEDWTSSADPQEALLTAKAASATIAGSCGDSEVADAMLAEDCARTIVALLDVIKSNNYNKKECILIGHIFSIE